MKHMFLSFEKGSKHCSRKPRKRGGSASKRGISNEQSCILVAIQRNGEAVAQNIGSGRQESDEIIGALQKLNLQVT